MRVLIIGGSGYIGRNLKEYFEKNNIEVFATTYPDKIEGFLYFNTIESKLSDLEVDLNSIDYAIICSAISNIAQCKLNPEVAYKVNVSGNIKVIEECWERNITPVFLSSDAVFDGKKGNYTEDDSRSPLNEYGKHKMEVEDFILKSNKKYLITRLSKVFGIKAGDGTFLTSLISDLKQGKTLNCATDQIFSPIYIGDLVELFYKAITKELTGLYNFASAESFSRYNLAVKLKEDLNIKTGQIVPCSISEIKSVDILPANITMSSNKIQKATLHIFRKMDELIKEILENIDRF